MGRVRNSHTGRIRSLGKKGRPNVCFGPSQTHQVHVLVAVAFYGPRPEGMWVCHNNGDYRDNRVENLRYDTPQSNADDRVKHGNNAYANRTHCKNGHAYTPDNLGKSPKGQGRRCLACHREYMRNRSAA